MKKSWTQVIYSKPSPLPLSHTVQEPSNFSLGLQGCCRDCVNCSREQRSGKEEEESRSSDPPHKAKQARSACLPPFLEIGISGDPRGP